MGDAFSAAAFRHPSGLLIRPATQADAETVWLIRLAAAEDLTARFGRGQWSAVQALDRVQSAIDEGGLFVAERGQPTIIVGTFLINDKKPSFYQKSWFTDPRAPALYLRELAIKPNQQRLGFGRAMMDAIEAIARACALLAVRFDAYQGPAGAGPFYQKCGYTCVHRGTIYGFALEYYEKQLAP